MATVLHQTLEHAVFTDLDGRMLIEGERRMARGGYFFKKSPVDGKAMPGAARGMPEDIADAVLSARLAFDDGRWSRTSPAHRKRVLLEWARLVREHSAELAMIETLDMGKMLVRALKSDVESTANALAWHGEAIDKVYGEVAPTASNVLALVTREPMGVIGAIVPWNYPLLMAAWKLGPALAAGNSVVLKPSERSPFSVIRLAELALRAGLPSGVLNVVPGYGHEAGMALALHEDVDAVGFTGSTRVGRLMLEFSGRSNLKRVYGELGGKSAVIVMPDANLQQAAQATAASMFFNQGESCNAPARLLVHRAVRDEFVEAYAEQARRYKPGSPLAVESGMGALVDEAHMKSVLGHISMALGAGARCVTGGRQVLTETGGWYVSPTVFEGGTPDMRVADEEIFGPVACVLSFETEAEAIRLANDTWLHIDEAR